MVDKQCAVLCVDIVESGILNIDLWDCDYIDNQKVYKTTSFCTWNFSGDVSNVIAHAKYKLVSTFRKHVFNNVSSLLVPSM